MNSNFSIVDTFRTDMLLQLLCTNPPTVNQTLAVLLHTGDETKVERLFYATVLSLVMGQRAPKHVFCRYCNCDEFFVCVGLHCGNNFMI